LQRNLGANQQEPRSISRSRKTVNGGPQNRGPPLLKDAYAPSISSDRRREKFPQGIGGVLPQPNPSIVGSNPGSANGAGGSGPPMKRKFML